MKPIAVLALWDPTDRSWLAVELSQFDCGSYRSQVARWLSERVPHGWCDGRRARLWTISGSAELVAEWLYDSDSRSWTETTPTLRVAGRLVEVLA